MIEIRRASGKIEIDGRAGFALRGQDIVFAGVSALVQVFIASVEELTEDNIKSDIADGKAVIEYGNLSVRGDFARYDIFGRQVRGCSAGVESGYFTINILFLKCLYYLSEIP